MTDQKTLTVFGSFGFGNLGDELVPECFRNLLQAAGRPEKVQALSRFRGIELGESAAFPDFEAAADGPQDGTMVLAGGGIIEARDMSCMNRAFLLQNARQNLRVTTHAVSVEPGVKFTWRQRRALERQLKHTGPTTVRDALSAETLMRLVPGHQTRVIGDIALWMEPGEIPADLAAHIPDRAIPVILADFWDTPDFLDWLTDELVDLARNMDLPLLLLPFSGAFGHDLEIYANLRDRLTAAAPDVEVAHPMETIPFSAFTPSIVAAVIKAAPLVVAMRLHGCVVSYAMRTPFLGLAYHPKLRGFAETVGWPDALVPRNLPLWQSPDTYGFAFSDLGLKRGDLSNAADKVMAETDFSAIPYFRRLQVTAVKDLIARLP